MSKIYINPSHGAGEDYRACYCGCGDVHEPRDNVRYYRTDPIM